MEIIEGLGVFDTLTLITFNKKISAVHTFRRGQLTVIELPAQKTGILIWLGHLLAIRRIVKQNRITHLHPWCTTAGSIGLLLKLLAPKKRTLTIDSFEPHAEAMIENGSWRKSSLRFRMLFYFEKLQARKADYLIFAASGMKDYIREKYNTQPARYAVKPACVDLEAFALSKSKNQRLLQELGLDGKTVCVYAGKFGGIYLEEEVFEFFAACYAHWQDQFRVLLLTNTPIGELRPLMDRYHLPHSLFSIRFVPHAEVPDYIGLGDFAICPVKPVPSKKYCTPIKNGEYWAMGLPVVIPEGISDDSGIIENSQQGAVLQALSAGAYREAVEKIAALLQHHQPAQLKAQIRQLAETHRNYSIAQKVYSQLYRKN